MTLEQSIKYFNDIAADYIARSEYWKAHPDFDKDGTREAACYSIACEYFLTADRLKLLKEIVDSGSCNDCGYSSKCYSRPRPGQIIRFNCPMYRRERK